MTERKPSGMSFESFIDKQIREAIERGEFDDLPGAGKPLPGLDKPHDDQWWLKGYLRREGLTAEALLPESLQLRKEIDRLPETVRGFGREEEVRAHVKQLNRRIAEWMRTPTPPHVPLAPVDVDAVTDQWRSVTPATPAATPRQEAPRRRRWWQGRDRGQ
ncbi:protein of unknown function [Amycolatopsis xylanica]|uniref:DnaJ homologue subfamily C member 28 conserved domain-containing protein n=1 Tax=Amycolatopsis xylanica TaxID=589385 RepID=A0A1H2V4M1_9PSEU|nr:DUF1992 domain-containing protein [Amycolatopsis xylanica]SDW63248.1 protein of unknown function [Amycolatopsis xylanica]